MDNAEKVRKRRQRILQMAIHYLQANLEDANEAFGMYDVDSKERAVSAEEVAALCEEIIPPMYRDEGADLLHEARVEIDKARAEAAKRLSG